jgi:hypothetical protein
VIFESRHSSRQGTKAKQIGIIYDRLVKVHGDKENADTIKTKWIGAYPMPHNCVIVFGAGICYIFTFLL